MAEAPPPPPTPPPPPPPVPDHSSFTQYWCYQCNKRVPIETLPGQADVICFECKNGFVEVISLRHPQPVEVNDEDHPAFGNEFLQVLRLIAMAAREDDAPPLPPDLDGNDNDYLRIELDGWDENDEDDDDDEDDDNEAEDEDEGDETENRNQVDRVPDRSDGHEDNEDVRQIVEDREADVDVRRRQRRDIIRLRLRDFATRALSRRHRILDWAEILTGLEDHSVEFRFQPSGDGYVGNPGDYVDAAGYEALLQNLAENDNGKRGAPPAATSAVEALPTVKVKSAEIEVCTICKDKLFNSEEEIVKQLPCGHMYHEECIVPWLGSRNSCPVCRFELPTDDAEYEEDRKKRSAAMPTTSTASDDSA